jgi:hypothetical protein
LGISNLVKQWKIEQQGPERYTIAKLDDFTTDRYCWFHWPSQAKDRVECGTKTGTAPPQEWIIKEAPSQPNGKSYMYVSLMPLNEFLMFIF